MSQLMVTGASALLALAAIAGPGVAPLAAEPEGLTTWSVEPAQAGGPDDRSWIERDVDPGEAVTEHLAVTNFSDSAVTFALTAADGYFTETGRFTMLSSSEESTAAGSWITVAPTVEIAPGATSVVPFVIEVPENATPGDSAAGVAASVFSESNSEDGTQVGVESRVGFRVMLRVSGALDPSLAIDAASGAYELSWNPLRPGSVSVGYAVVNTGNTRLLVNDATTTSGRFGERPASAPSEVELLPGDRREVTQTIDQVWPIGLIRIAVDVDATIVPGDSTTSTPSHDVWVWAVPWPHLIVIAGAAMVLLAVLWRRRKHRADVDRLVAAALREGEARARSREEAVAVDSE